MRCIILSLLVMLCGALLAAPYAVEKVADDMLSAGVELRAGSTEKLGVFVVASASVEVKDSVAKARNAARALAQKNLAGFLNTRIEAKDVVSTKYVSEGEKTNMQEFFSSLTETSVRELLKGCSNPRNLRIERFTEGWKRRPPLYGPIAELN